MIQKINNIKLSNINGYKHMLHNISEKNNYY